MDKNLDLRITKTDKMIREAFLELVNTIGFEKITVTNLTSKALISRTTFYLHYMDKYDLLEQMEKEILTGIKNITINFLDTIEAEKFTEKKFYSLLFRIYKYIEENKKIFELFVCNNVDPFFYRKFNEVIEFIYYQSDNINMVKVPQHYVLAYIKGIHMSIIDEWIKTGMKETPKEIVSMIFYIMHNFREDIFVFYKTEKSQ
ncbi:TetR/AcrR family transcriptional regulator [Intestinibacter sp.]|uniref:TetR/AcrR family transcriptional regulator n=1 Tax=Intestinibacter sp. TaxID=1965304 RepID=UPI003F17B550